MTVYLQKTVEESETEEGAAQLHVQWDVNGKDIQYEYTESFTVPEDVLIEQDQDGTLQIEDVEVGTFTASTEGLVEVFFNEEIEGAPEASGQFTVDVTLTNVNEEVNEEPAVEEEFEESASESHMDENGKDSVDGSDTITDEEEQEAADEEVQEDQDEQGQNEKGGEDSSATSQKDSQQKDESAVNPTDETEETKDAGQGKIQSHSIQ